MDGDKEDEVTMGGETTEHDEGGATATNDPGMGDEDPKTGEKTGEHEALGAGDTHPNPTTTTKSRKDKRSQSDFLHCYDDDAEGDVEKAVRLFRDALLEKPYEELSHEMRAKVDEAEMLLIKRGDYVLRKRRRIDVDKDHDKLTDVTSGFQSSQDNIVEQSQPDENEVPSVRVVET